MKEKKAQVNQPRNYFRSPTYLTTTHVSTL